MSVTDVMLRGITPTRPPSLHTIACTTIDFGPTLVSPANPAQPVEAVEDWRHESPVEDGQVLVRLTLRQPQNTGSVDVLPTFTRLLTLQISDSPVEYRTVGSAMDVTRDAVLSVIFTVTHLLGLQAQPMEELDLGEEHEAVAAEYGGSFAILHAEDGTMHRVQLPER
jgi:hypothetical protein